MEDNTFRIQEHDYWLEIKANASTLKINAVIFGDDKRQIKKLSRILNMETQTRQLLHFQNAKEIVRMLMLSRNYKLSCDNQQLAINWKIVSPAYEKKVVCNISLFKEKIKKMEKLQLENLFLRRKIKMVTDKMEYYEPIAESLSPKKGYDSSSFSNSSENFESEENQNSKQQPNQSEVSHPILNKKQQIIELSQENQPTQSQKSHQKQTNQKQKQKRSRKKIQKNPYNIPPTERGKKKQRKILKKNDQETSKNSKNSCESTKKVTRSSKCTSFRNNSKEDAISTKTKSESEKTVSPINPDGKIISKTKIGLNKVKINYSNGDWYEGQVNFKGSFHGFGTYSSKITGTYEGEWANGSAEGKGTSTDIFGNKHEGQYFQDHKHGWGSQFYVNGEKYIGDFDHDSKNGLGKYWFANQDCYEGEWKNDSFDGTGVETYANGAFFSGKWKNDEKDGEGLYVDEKGNKLKQIWEKDQLRFQERCQ